MGWFLKWDFFFCIKFQNLNIMSTFCVISILLILVFRCIREKQQEESRQNLSQKYNIMQKENYLKEQLLTNKTLEYGILKNQTLQQKKEIASLFKEKMRCHRKQGILSKSLQNTGMEEFMSDR